MTNCSESALDGFGVEISLYSVIIWIMNMRHDRLVLRRAVTVESVDEQRVEELWISPPLPMLQAQPVLKAILGEHAAAMMLAEPVHGLPSLDLATAGRLDELVAEVDGHAKVRLLLICRTRVRVDTRARRLRSAEVIGGSGLVGRRARLLMSAAITRLGLIGPSGSGTARSRSDGASTDWSQPDEARADGDGTAGARSAGMGGDETGTGTSGEVATPGGGLGATPHVALVGPMGEQVSGAEGVTRASTTARDRLAQAELWQKFSTAPLSISALPGASTGLHDDARWLQAVRDASAPPSGNSDPDCVVATFIDVSGGVVGAGARQTNLFQYRLSPHLDLGRALRRTDVRESFAAYASYAARTDADPARCARLRANAVNSLQNALPAGRTDWGAGERPEGPTTTPVNASVPTTHGVVVLQDCRGIQVGNDVRQFNTFGYVLAPDVKVSELLRKNPGLAESIVDYACAINGSAATSVQQRLANAVCDSAEAALPRTPGAGMKIAYPVSVQGDVGQVAGPRGRQADITKVRVDPLARVSRELQRVQRNVDVARAAAEIAREKVAAVSRLSELASPWSTPRWLTEPGRPPGAEPRGPSHGPSLEGW